MATLYELTGQMLTLQEMMEDPEEDEQMIENTMEGIDYEFEVKSEGYAKVDRNLKALEEGLKAEIERLERRKRTISNNRDRLKRALEKAMRVTGKLKFKTPLFSFSIQKNPPSVNILDEGMVPDQFLIKHEPTVDKKALIAFVKEHGDTDYAELTQTESLRIR